MEQGVTSVTQPCNNTTSEISATTNTPPVSQNLLDSSCSNGGEIRQKKREVRDASQSHKKKGIDELKHELFNSPSESESSIR